MANTYDTSLFPLGSTKPKVLYNNASNFDDALNAFVQSWIDRFGRTRKTMYGFEQDFNNFLISSGFEPNHLTYVDGVPLQVDRATQLIDRAGSVYRVKMPATFPVTLTGTWASDQTLLVDVGDQSLRAALAAVGGSAMIGTPRGTLEADLLALLAADVATNARIDAVVANLPPVNNAQPLMSRSAMVLNHGHMINIGGDSIAAGAYGGNLPTNGWPNLLAKAVNDQFNAKNLGTYPMDALYNPVPAYLTNQIHDVTWFGDWGARVGSVGIYDWPLGLTGAAAGDAINGKTVVSVNNTAYFEIVCPSINPVVTIYYVGRPDGGSFDVTINGVFAGTLNTFQATKTYNLIYTLIANDGGQGEFTVRFTKTDTSPTEVQPVVRYTKTTGSIFQHFQMANVNNFSVSGRQMARMSEQAIVRLTNCAVYIHALGYNDIQAETDDLYYADLVQRADWIILYANNQDTLVVVNDFCWYSAPTSRVRTQLKRIAEETNGIYIPFPDKIYPDGAIVPNISPLATALIDPMRLFADNAHPEKFTEVIFSETAQALGLSVTSKRQALLNDLPYPVKLQGTLKNKAGDISTVSRTENGLLYSLGVTASGGGTIAPSGGVPTCVLPAKFNGATDVRASTAVLSLTTGGLVNNFVNVLVDGSVSSVVVNASVIEGSFFVASKTL